MQKKISELEKCIVLHIMDEVEVVKEDGTYVVQNKESD